MFSLSAIFGKNNVEKKTDAIAELLKVSPEALSAFNEAYSAHTLQPEDTDNLFDINSRQAAEMNWQENSAIGEGMQEGFDPALFSRVKRSIVDDLVKETSIFTAGRDGSHRAYSFATGRPPMTSLDDVNSLPAKLRPFLTASAARRDISEPAYMAVMEMYRMWQENLGKNSKLAMQAYNQFRQGLDIMDVDPVLHAIIGKNANSMGHWLPYLAKAVELQGFFQIPKTTVAKIPWPLLQMTRLDYMSLNSVTVNIINEYCTRVFGLKADGSCQYFIKTGTCSSKQDFRNAHVTDPKEITEIGSYLTFIHHQALQMASPLCRPCIWGAGTTNEWVVREFIPDPDRNPEIYHGLPLRTEYRFFVDCDEENIMGCAPYWDEKSIVANLTGKAKNGDTGAFHDLAIYKAQKGKLESAYNENILAVSANMEKIVHGLKKAGLTGQWSVDVMQSGSSFWIIDMALANSSALNGCVQEKLKPVTENWLPDRLAV